MFGTINLTKNSDPDKYQHSGYGIGFDSRGSFTHGDYGVNVIIFGCDLGRSLFQELNGKTLYVEKLYSSNLTVTNKTFVLSLHYNADDRYLFVNGKEVTNFKAKDSEIKPYPLCLGTISKDLVQQMHKRQGDMGMCMILVLIMEPLQIITYLTFTSI